MKIGTIHGAAVGLAVVALLSVAERGDAAIVYNQPSQFPGLFNAITSQSQASGGQFQSFDNFTLTSTEEIESVAWQGFFWNPRGPSFNPVTNPAPLSFKIDFYAN